MGGFIVRMLRPEIRDEIQDRIKRQEGWKSSIIQCGNQKRINVFFRDIIQQRSSLLNNVPSNWLETYLN